jgi:hypothetical protein
MLNKRKLPGMVPKDLPCDHHLMTVLKGKICELQKDWVLLQKRDERRAKSSFRSLFLKLCPQSMVEVENYSQLVAHSLCPTRFLLASLDNPQPSVIPVV